MIGMMVEIVFATVIQIKKLRSRVFVGNTRMRNTEIDTRATFKPMTIIGCAIF